MTEAGCQLMTDVQLDLGTEAPAHGLSLRLELLTAGFSEGTAQQQTSQKIQVEGVRLLMVFPTSHLLHFIGQMWEDTTQRWNMARWVLSLETGSHLNLEHWMGVDQGHLEEQVWSFSAWNYGSPCDFKDLFLLLLYLLIICPSRLSFIWHLGKGPLQYFEVNRLLDKCCDVHYKFPLARNFLHQPSLPQPVVHLGLFLWWELIFADSNHVFL